MKDVIALIDVICDVYDNPRYIPKGDGTTFCNYAAQDLCHAYGCNDFDGKTADQIVGFVESSANWKQVSMVDSQVHANAGSLVFAMESSVNLGQSHGHLCVIRPGKFKDSGKWGLTPCCMNIGAENFIGRAKKGPLTAMACGINEAFIPPPRFFVLASSI